MNSTKLLFVLAGALGLAACNHVEATHNRCGGTTGCAKGACDPIDVLSCEGWSDGCRDSIEDLANGC